MIATQRITLYAERNGAGAPLLWISGTGGDLRKPPSIFATPIGKGFDLVAYDQRGLGRSEKPAAPCTMADYADDAAALMDAIGWPRAHVAGYSFGGMVAQHLAIRHPTRVDRLVLAATTAGGAGGASFPLHELEHLDPFERAKRAICISDQRIPPERVANPDAEMRSRIEMSVRFTEKYLDEPGAREGRARQLEARRGHDAFEALSGVTHETLVCGGLHDGLASKPAVEALAARVPNARLSWYAGSHLFLIECPEFLADVALFLGGR